jgi:hypothetical protein
VGVVCGGKRCIGGLNAGAACTTGSECPSGGCGRPGVQTQPNGLRRRHLHAEHPPDNDSSNEGTCLVGPAESFCVIEAYRYCSTNADCTAPGGSSGPAHLRECFTENGVIGDTPATVTGVESPTAPTLGALLCAPPTGVGWIDLGDGLPGLGRLTIPGTAVMN